MGKEDLNRGVVEAAVPQPVECLHKQRTHRINQQASPFNGHAIRRRSRRRRRRQLRRTYLSQEDVGRRARQRRRHLVEEGDGAEQTGRPQHPDLLLLIAQGSQRDQRALEWPT
ncbi:Os04g0280650 [Oryza sativa Japonica Group]|uniref:Os04g0280650 protein n=1 Tax=Oryza sativa subsp. japonica TaxID=39947 RepID=A0A0P0W7W4_ORYSJ|nr:hypothetical protein EE612_022786 [Oryza sativa]BAS88372.1 Os04g0280650 [Oryza sativa Japonica Group]